ncbi:MULTISPECIES: hypothetical protein [Neobacillus]|uniref:Uncharacterized protein n=1 Tax=Neobacillus vireti LMG 21834 TaxID=1131730 RepID=A0AB94IUI1_9BACI|nr:hypothetical protein [Neobacillus vireti]ETI70638.1 hypothetical protein BAVI_01660 [Neobacillus vireti LMG 21834]KLT15288.1 hypothetical protein AA980_24270 [Neobacillus vireti]
MSRGEHFEHKKKNHPGNFPKDSLTEKHVKEAIGDEEFLVTREAFKNRVEEEDMRGDTARLLPEQME